MPLVCGGAVDSAVSSVRERGRHAMQASLAGAYVHGDGAGSIELAREGNGWPLTHVWRVENSTAGSSFHVADWFIQTFTSSYTTRP